MKKLSLLILLAGISFYSFSQKNFDKENFFRFGFKAGVNINKLQGKSFSDEFSYNFSLGGFMQFNFSRKLGLQPEVNFVQSSSEQSDDFSEIYDDITLTGRQVRAKLDYLKIAPLLNFNVGPTQRIKLQFGPQWGLLLNEKVDTITTSENIFKKSDFSLVGGIMFQLPLVHIGARYEHGLTNINDIDDQDKWKSQSFQLFAGLTF